MSAFESHFCGGNGYLKLGNVNVLLNFDSQMKIIKILKLERMGYAGAARTITSRLRRLKLSIKPFWYRGKYILRSVDFSTILNY